MARKIKIIVTGDKELDAALKHFASKETNKFARKVLRAGAKIVLEEAKTSVPVRSGNYKRSLTVRALKKSRKGARTGRIGSESMGYVVTQRGVPAKPTEDDRKTGFYGSFLEMGYSPGRRRKAEVLEQNDAVDATVKKRKKSPARIQGRWYLRQAAQRKEEHVRDYWLSSMWNYVLRGLPF